MEHLKKEVRIVPMTREHLDEVATLERACFSTPWSRNMLAEELDNAAAAYLACSALSAMLSPYGARTLLGGSRRDGRQR